MILQLCYIHVVCFKVLQPIPTFDTHSTVFNVNSNIDFSTMSYLCRICLPNPQCDPIDCSAHVRLRPRVQTSLDNIVWNQWSWWGVMPSNGFCHVNRNKLLDIQNNERVRCIVTIIRDEITHYTVDLPESWTTTHDDLGAKPLLVDLIHVAFTLKRFPSWTQGHELS